MSVLLINGNALQIPLADNSVHCVVTSPPYWSLRDYGIDDQLGLEQTPEEYVANMVAVFREVRRVLRDDGTCWVNLGDSYAASSKGETRTPEQLAAKSGLMRDGRPEENRIRTGERSKISVASMRGKQSFDLGYLKPKDLVGIPWRIAFALQADGWWLRSDIIWSKPNPMPESVTDRPTKAHEYLFLLAKSQRYYYDADAVREAYQQTTLDRDDYTRIAKHDKGYLQMKDTRPHVAGLLMHEQDRSHGGRNRRTVWEIATAPYSGAHFATYPPALVEPCIKAGTSERGVCPVCGAGWRRVVEKGELIVTGHTANNPKKYHVDGGGDKGQKLFATVPPGMAYEKTTLGWQPACNCPPHEPIPATVFDPFAGSGTTLMVARKLGRHGVGLDLSLRYLVENARQRLELDRLDAWGSDGKKDGKVIDDLPLFQL